MAFNINAQIILQAPKNVKAITQSIQNQLQGVSINVGANIPKNVQSQLNNLNNTLTKTGKSNKGVSTSGLQAVNTLNSMGKSAKHAGGAMHMLGKETALTFKRFAAAGIVTATFFRMTQAISEAVPKALEFQREMVRLQQITGKTSKELGTVTKAVRSLSTQLGVDANELANISKIFAQTGQSIREIQASVRAVARSSLAPTFGEMEQTAEGLVAALNQFNIAASQSEAVLGSLNRVSKKFAVESQDLIAAVRRAGGVFAIAAGDTKKPIEALQEFTAVFTAVRSTTRESAETVATGLRTIFTRLQRRGTIDALKALGINLTDANGKFIGLFESFRTLSRELDTIIQKGDAITLSGITEELGGMRQVGKLIPAIKEFRKAEAALLEAQRGAQEGLGSDVAKGLTPLIKQFELVRERFNELIRGLTESGAFNAFAKTAIGLANAFLAVGEAITPILPALTALAGIKIGRAFSGFASGFFGSFGSGGGVKGAGQGLGNLASGGGKSAAQTASNTQAVGNLSSALGTNTTTLSTNNNNLTTINTTLNNLKGTIDPVKSALGNLTNAINNLRTVIAAKPAGGGFIGGGGGRPRGGARPPRGFASGGLVPGTGNRDTVPAMLTPGEFVIRKSAVKSIGTGALGEINGYNKGGVVVNPKRVGVVSLAPPVGSDNLQDVKGIGRITNPEALRRMRKGAIDNTKLTAVETNAFLNGSLNSQAAALGIDTSAINPRTGKPFTSERIAQQVGNRLGIKVPSRAKSIQVTPENIQKLQNAFAKNPKLFPKGKGVLRKGGFATTKEQSVEAEFKGQLSAFTPGLQEQFVDGDVFEEKIFKILQGKLDDAIQMSAQTMAEDFLIQPISLQPQAVASKAIANLLARGSGAMNTITGFILEGIIGALTAAPVGGNNVSFDFPTLTPATRENLTNLFSPNDRSAFTQMLKVDAKKKFSNSFGQVSNENGVAKKVLNDINKGNFQGVTFQQFAKGGAATGTDTVPAMLTPGEYVINKSAAQAFGYGNLKQINRYNQGGVVKKGRSFYGNGPDLSGNQNLATVFNQQSSAQSALAKQTERLKNSFKSLGGAGLNAFFGFQSLSAGLEMMKDETQETGMALVNLGFGVSMLAPAIVSIVGVLDAGFAAMAASFAAGGTAMGGFTAVVQKLTVQWGKLGAIGQAAIIASVGFIGKFINDYIQDQLLGTKKTIGETGDVSGRTGVTAGRAGTAGAIGGGIMGGAVGLGAGRLAGLNTAGTLAAGAIGAMVSAINSYTKELNAQADFLELEKVAKSNEQLGKIQEKLTDATLLTSSDMQELASATNQLTANIISQGLGIAGFNNTGALGFGVGSGAVGVQNQILGRGLGGQNRNPFNRLTQEFFSGQEDFTIPAATLFQNSDGTQTQGQRDQFTAAQVRGLSAVADDIFKEVNMEEIGKRLQFSIDATFSSLEQSLDQLDTQSLKDLPNDIQGASKAMNDLGISTAAFETAVDAATSASLTLKAAEKARSSDAQDKAVASAFAILSDKAGDLGSDITTLSKSMTQQEFVEFAKSAGLSGQAAENAAKEVQLLAKAESDRISNELAEQLIVQKKLARAAQIANSAIDTFVSTFTRFANSVEQSSAEFTNFTSSFDSFVDNIGSAQFEVRERINPFENIDASSFDQLNSAVDRILAVGGTATQGAGFEGIREIVALQKTLPDVISEVTRKALEEPKAQTQDEIGTSLKDEVAAAITALDPKLDSANIPPAIFEGLQSTINSLIGNRQDAAGTTEDELKRLLSSEDFEKIMEEFGEATSPVIEALATLDDAVNNVAVAQIQLLQIQTEFINKEIEARLKGIEVINKTSDALDKFRPGGGPKNTVERAEQRVLERQRAIVGAGIGGFPAVATLDVEAQQRRVQNLRNENKNIRQRLANAGGPVIGPDITAAEGVGFNQTDVESEQAALLENSKQLSAHEKALQELINSTDVLDATMAELGEIEKSRMDSRQLAQFEAKRFANILNEQDPVKRAKLMQEQFAGDVAFDKLQGGQALTPQDIAALIDGGLERRLAIGVAAGDITEEDAENRRAQFNKFLSEVGLPAMNAALGNPFGGAAMDQLIAATALGGTAQGTTDEEKDLISKAEEEAEKKRKAILAEQESAQTAFNTAIGNAATELSSFTQAVADAATKVNDAQDEMERKLKEAQEIRESAASDKPSDIVDEEARKFGQQAEESGEAGRKKELEESAAKKRESERLSRVKNEESRLARSVDLQKRFLAAQGDEGKIKDLTREGFTESQINRASEDTIRQAQEKLNKFRQENQAALEAPIRAEVSGDTASDLAKEKDVEFKLNRIAVEKNIDKESLLAATSNVTGDDAVRQTQLIISAINEIDRLIKEGQLDPADRTNLIRQAIGASPQGFSAGGNEALKPLEAMHKEMTTPGSIFVHDIHAEKLLIEIVKLLGGSEQHLQRAAEAAKAEIAGLKSPTSAGVAGNVRSAASDSMVQELKSDPASVAAFMKSPEGTAIAESVMNQRPGDGQFLSGFAAQGFEEMLASGQFGGNLESLGTLTPSFDSQAILDDIAETLGIPTGVSNQILQSMSADEVQRAAQRFSQPVGPVPVPKLSPEEKRAMDERNKIGIQDPNLLTAENRLDKEFERARNIEDNNRREEARIAEGKGRSPLAQDIFDLQQQSAGLDRFTNMLELMLSDLKGEDVSNLTQEDIDRRKFGRLSEAEQTRKVVADSLLAAQGGREEGLAAGRFKQGDIESAVSGIGGTRFGRFLNDKQKLDAEVAIRDQASRMGIVSGRTGDASKSQIQLKALEELDAKTNVITRLPKSIDDSLNIRGQRPTGAAQVFGGFSEAISLIRAEEDEKELLERTGLSREELSKKIAENRRKQAQQGNVGGGGLSAERVQARVLKLSELEFQFGDQLAKDPADDTDFIARIRKQRDTLANDPRVQAKLEADRLAEEQRKAEAARIAKEEEDKKNAAMTRDPSSRTPLPEGTRPRTSSGRPIPFGMLAGEYPAAAVALAQHGDGTLPLKPKFKNDPKTGLQHAAAPPELKNMLDFANSHHPFQPTDEDRANMVKSLVASGDLTSLMTSFDSLNTDAVPNLVQALSDLNTTLTTGAAGGAATGEEGVNIRSLVDAINSLDQVTVNVAVAPVNVILNTGGLADQLRNVIAAEALKALKDKIGPTIDAEVDRIISNRTAG